MIDDVTSKILIERSNRVSTLILDDAFVGDNFGLAHEDVLPLLFWIQGGDAMCACGKVAPKVCIPVDDMVWAEQLADEKASEEVEKAKVKR